MNPRIKKVMSIDSFQLILTFTNDEEGLYSKNANKTTRQTLGQTDAGENLIICENAGDMFKKLGI